MLTSPDTRGLQRAPAEKPVTPAGPTPWTPLMMATLMSPFDMAEDVALIRVEPDAMHAYPPPSPPLPRGLA